MMNRFPVGALLSAVLFVLMGGATGARAGATDPTLSISSATAATGETSRRVEINAAFPRADIVQIGYPVQLLVWEEGGSNYLRFDLSNGVYAGSDPSLADGLNPTEALTLVGAGTPTNEAAVLRMEAARLRLSVPASFPGGTTRVQLFVIDDGDPLLSNASTFSLPSLGGSQ